MKMSWKKQSSQKFFFHRFFQLCEILSRKSFNFFKKKYINDWNDISTNWRWSFNEFENDDTILQINWIYFIFFHTSILFWSRIDSCENVLPLRDIKKKFWNFTISKWKIFFFFVFHRRIACFAFRILKCQVNWTEPWPIQNWINKFELIDRSVKILMISFIFFIYSLRLWVSGYETIYTF